MPLKKLIDKEKPDFLIIHLITSLPLILLIFFNFNTKFILRISGMPKLNFFRKVLWKLISKKIYLVTCPTITTLNYLISLKYRYLKEYSKIPHYIITKTGTVLQLLNNTDVGYFFQNPDIDIE